MEEQYEAEIHQLCEEISLLEAEKENYDREVSLHYGQHLHSVLGVVVEDELRNKQDIAKLMEEVEKMEKNLARQIGLNKIILTSCCAKTIEKSKTKVVQQYQLKGHCYHLSFNVEFMITEEQEDDTLMRKVTNLHVVVDGQHFADISSVLSRMEETNSLLLLFKTLKSFSENCEHRSKTFQHFKEKYPDIVSLPEGCLSALMLIQSPKLKGCSICIFWDTDVTLEGEVRPKLDLLMKTPDKAMRMDSMNVVENAPEYFQNLLNAVGAETSIECIIKTVLV